MNIPILVEFKADISFEHSNSPPGLKGRFCRKGAPNTILTTPTYKIDVIGDLNLEINLTNEEIYDLAKQNKELKEKLKSK